MPSDGQTLRERLRDLVPWRLRSWNNFVTATPNVLFSRIRKTPPVEVDPDSPYEIHSLLCHRDVNMMLVSAKTALRFLPRMAVVMHDDGSLTGADRATVERHLPGVRIIHRADADHTMRELLPADVYLRRQQHVFLLKLFDFNHFNRGSHTVLLDADIVFLRAPEEIVSWLSREKPPPFYNLDWCPSYRASRMPEGRNLPQRLNAGFMGFAGCISQEAIYQVCRELDYWIEDQTLYAVLLADQGAKALDPVRYVVYTGQEITPEASMVHFISPSRFKGFVYPRLAAGEIRKLRQSAAGR